MRSTILILFFLVGHKVVWADSKKLLKVGKIGYVYDNYSGTTNKSFTEGQPGQGLEISIDNGGEYFRYFIKSRFIYSSGTQNFLDGAAIVKSNYTLLHLAPEIGASVYLVSRKNKGLNLYLWGSGMLSYSMLELSPISSTSSSTGSTTSVTEYSILSKKDQGFGYGFGAGVGIEYIISITSQMRQKMIYADIGFREQNANLAKKDDFQINTLSFSLGFGF